MARKKAEVKTPELVKETTPEVVEETTTENQTVTLEINTGFTDKYTDERYIVGKTYEFDKARAEELLADSRSLVCVHE